MVFQLLSFKERRHGPGRVGSGRSYVRFHHYVEENFARASHSLVMMSYIDHIAMDIISFF